MANFGKYANLSKQGWNESTSTQTIQIGQNAHIGLWGGGPAGEDLIVKSTDPSVCVVHEEPPNKAYPHWRHFLLTALKDGGAAIMATLPNGMAYAAPMYVVVTGKTGVRLVFFPGERLSGSATVGTIYVIGGSGESIRAAGGPPTGYADHGGHTAEPTPPGNYTIGPRIHVVAPSWPMSSIPWGATLRFNAAGEVEFESSPGRWSVATGNNGVVVQAYMSFFHKDKKNPKLSDVVAGVRKIFVDTAKNTLLATTWERNDFGRWGWNLLSGGHGTPYFIHTTPDDEFTDAKGKAVFLTNSHGCIHLVPSERDKLMNAGYLKQGVPFEVRPYTEAGPPP